MPDAAGAGPPLTGRPLSGRVGLVVGGSSGIGLAVAAGYLRAGSEVVVWSRAATRSAAVAELAGRYGTVHAIDCDVAEPASIIEALRGTVAVVGRIDHAFSGAGVNAAHPFLATPWPTCRETLRVNLLGNALVLQALGRHMAERGGGDLVVTSSIAALRGQATTADYAAGKAALTALAKAAAVELAGAGVRINVLTPGYVRTPLLAPYLADRRFTAKVVERTPAGRIATPAELVPLAVWLATGAGSYLTGAEFVADGGYTRT